MQAINVIRLTELFTKNNNTRRVSSSITIIQWSNSDVVWYTKYCKHTEV